MASLLNRVQGGYQNLSGGWEDVQWYTGTKITIKSQQKGEAHLYWADNQRGTIPTNSDVIKQLDISYIDTCNTMVIDRDHFARWFKLDYTTEENGISTGFTDCSLDIECKHLFAPTSVRIVDGSNDNINDVTHGGLSVGITDHQGQFVSSTSTTELNSDGVALKVTLRDDSNNALNTVTGNGGQSLAVALRDNYANNLSTLGLENSNSLVIHTSDTYGHSQASTALIQNAEVDGRAMYLAQGVDSTYTSGVKDNGYQKDTNALYVSLLDATSEVISHENPLYIRLTDDTAQTKSYDIEGGVDNNLTSDTVLLDKVVVLQSVNIYNDGGSTVWLNIYDLSSVDVAISIPPNISIPVGAGQTREINMGKGSHFNNGVVFNALTVPYNLTNNQPTSPEYSPGENTVFVQGTYNNGVLANFNPGDGGGTAGTIGNGGYD